MRSGGGNCWRTRTPTLAAIIIMSDRRAVRGNVYANEPVSCLPWRTSPLRKYALVVSHLVCNKHIQRLKGGFNYNYVEFVK